MDFLRIVAIGGGDIGSGQTEAFDRRIIELTGKTTPRVLFLPTASFDSREYSATVTEAYGRLGCSVETLYLWDGYSAEEIEATIQATKWNDEPHRWEFRGDRLQVRRVLDEADIVYVGGGNTRRMIEIWKCSGVDVILREAAARGAVLCGVSAGCICWGRYGNSDAALTEGLGMPTMRIDCLDFLPIAMCPHLSGEPFRLGDFKAMMADTPGVGIGLDDGCALEYVDGEFRILSCIPGAVAHRVTASKHEILRPDPFSKPFPTLLDDPQAATV